jgi:hypothetical protein
MELPLKTKAVPTRASAQMTAQSTSVAVCGLVVVMVGLSLFLAFVIHLYVRERYIRKTEQKNIKPADA